MRIAFAAALFAFSSFAANGADPDALYVQGRDAIHAGNDAQGIPLLRQAAIGGHATAQEHLGFLYGTGAYSPGDPEELVAWLEERGNQYMAQKTYRARAGHNIP